MRLSLLSVSLPATWGQTGVPTSESKAWGEGPAGRREAWLVSRAERGTELCRARLVITEGTESRMHFILHSFLSSGVSGVASAPPIPQMRRSLRPESTHGACTYSHSPACLTLGRPLC